jgi:hypothetical protein
MRAHHHSNAWILVSTSYCSEQEVVMLSGKGRMIDHATGDADKHSQPSLACAL